MENTSSDHNSLPNIPLTNSLDAATKAGAQLRQSVERMEQDLRKHDKQVASNIAKLAACMVPELQYFRRLEENGWGNQVKVHFSLAGCPKGECRRHPTAAARDPLAYMLARWCTHPDECAKISGKMNWAISKAAALAAHLANQGVSSAEEARAIIKKEGDKALLKAYAETQERPSAKLTPTSQLVKKDEEGEENKDVESPVQNESEKSGSAVVKGSGQEPESAQAVPSGTEEAASKETVSDGSTGSGRGEEPVQDISSEAETGEVSEESNLQSGQGANPLDSGGEAAREAALEARKSQTRQEANPLGLSGTEVVERLSAAAKQLGKKKPDASVQLQHNCEIGSVALALIK